jgi:hypothetical protein
MHVDILLYADDIILLASNKRNMNIMLNELTAFGLRKEIKFNGSKTSLMVFNKTLEPITSMVQLQENRINLRLAGEDIKIEKKLKYLGVWFTQNLSSVSHIDIRSNNTISKITMLDQIGFNTQLIGNKTKSTLFNAFIRPIATYGLDVLTLTANDIKSICSLEGNIIKDSLGLFRRIKSSELFLALRIMPSFELIKKIKLALFLRLCENEYTKTVIKNIINDSKTTVIKDSLLNDIYEIISEKIDIQPAPEFDELINGSMFALNQLKREFNFEKEKNELVQEVRNQLNNKIIDRLKIEELLKTFEPNLTSSTSNLNLSEVSLI